MTNSTLFAQVAPENYQFQTLKNSTLENGRVRVICFSRPERFNSLSPLAYKEWLWAINSAANCPKCLVTVVVGTGAFYSSGNEMSQPTTEEYEGILAIRKLSQSDPNLKLLDAESKLDPKHRPFIQRGRITRDLIKSLINFPKLLIAGVNGPAIGFACTTLGLFDIVYAVERAWFQTPFMQWGFCAEGCSSVLFPRIFGPSMANQILYLGKKFKARDLMPFGFIADIFPENVFQKQVLEEACKISKSLPPEAFTKTKAIIQNFRVDELEKVNDLEMNLLLERMSSKECEERVAQFFVKKMKGKSSKL